MGAGVEAGDEAAGAGVGGVAAGVVAAWHQSAGSKVGHHTTLAKISLRYKMGHSSLHAEKVLQVARAEHSNKV
jgi:hypothetical protein